MDILLGLFTGGWGWVLSIGKRILPKLTLRNILIFIGICVLLYGQWKFYDWAHGRGEIKQAKADAAQIAQITSERNELQTKYTAYRGAFKTWVFRSELARINLAKANEKTIAEIEQRLQTSEAKRAKLQKDLKNAIPQFIPPAVDFDLPAGFVRLWNISLEGEPGSTAVPGGISQSLGYDAQAASGLTLSAFSVIGVENNQECVARGEVIREWQGWYYTSRDQFTKAQQESADAIPRLPADNGDTPPSNAITPTGQ
jgi:hypothetical protein